VSALGRINGDRQVKPVTPVSPPTREFWQPQRCREHVIMRGYRPVGQAGPAPNVARRA